MKHIVYIIEGLMTLMFFVLILALCCLVALFPAILSEAMDNWHWLWLYAVHFIGICYLIGEKYEAK